MSFGETPFPHANDESPAFHQYDPEGTYAHHTEVTRQLEHYVERHRLARAIELESQVERVSQLDDGTFEVQVRGGSARVFNRVVFANGRHHVPNIPPVPVDSRTRTFHSSALGANTGVFEGKHVVVVGCGMASASDVCELAAVSAASTTIVTHQTLFLAPRMRPDGLPMSAIAKRFHTLVPDKAVQSVLRKTMHKFPPDAPDDFTIGVHSMTVCWNLHELLNEGKVRVVLGAVSACRDGVSLIDDGSGVPCELPCDVLVFCTGYLSRTLELLDPPSRAKAEADLPWYENVFVPSLPGVAFMGAATSLWWFLELQADWISGVWSGRCDLPSADAMQVWLRNVRQWQAEVQASLPRKRKMLIPETPLASAVRLAKASGGWPGTCSMLCSGLGVFEPRMLLRSGFRVDGEDASP